jgi:hypothetical protein
VIGKPIRPKLCPPYGKAFFGTEIDPNWKNNKTKDGSELLPKWRPDEFLYFERQGRTDI